MSANVLGSGAVEDKLPRANDHKKNDWGIVNDGNGNVSIKKPKSYDEWLNQYEGQFGKGSGAAKMMADRFSKWDNKRYETFTGFKNDWEKEGKKESFDKYYSTRQMSNAKKQIAEEGAKRDAIKKQEYEGWKAYEQRKKEWNDEMRRRRDSPFAKIVDGLTKVADFAVKTPLVNSVVGGIYKKFAPPTSEYYKG